MIMDLEQRFLNLTIDDIGGFVSAAQEEHLSLEFKMVEDSSLKKQDDKRSLAVAIAGFANSAGGFIVWGIDARKNERGVDAALALSPIANLDRLISRLNELTGEATSPIVEGVKHRAIEIGENRGFAISLVPESTSGPHMARLGENRYFKRSGDSFYVMEHFDVQDMFGRRKRPELELNVRVTGSGSYTQIFLGIRNVGRGTARAPYLAFTIPAPFKLNNYGIDGNMHEGLPRLMGIDPGAMMRYGGDGATVIHPETTLEVASIYLGLGGRGPAPPTEGISLDYEITAEDIRMIRGTQRVELQ